MRCDPPLTRRRAALELSLLATAVALASGSQLEAAAKIEYNRDVRPILAENCFACHGPDSAARKGNLRLDKRDMAIESGALAPGKPAESEMITRIRADDDSQRMPPKRTHKVLTEAQKHLLEEWVRQGANYQPHWSFIAPVRPAVPAVRNQAWVRNPIDNFVLSRLEEAGLSPAPEADRRTLARRVSLDLTGLPPSPDMVEAFVQDKSPHAYEEFVDRLLRSPHWGEHRGRYWLDAARYADTHGIHFDNYREVWAYRDWVIGAFNRNLPFDQFTLEQLAGDLLPKRTLDQQIASGFNRCNITTNEGGVIAEEYLVLYARDRTETTSVVWLGLTAGCAVCHEHKFDPLSQREFYELAAFFNNTTQGAMDGNIKDTPPAVAVPRPEDRPRWQALQAEREQLAKQMATRKEALRPELDKWLRDSSRANMTGQIPSHSLRFHAPLLEDQGKPLSLLLNARELTIPTVKGTGVSGGHIAAKAYRSVPGGIIAVANAGKFDGNQPFSYAAWVRLPRRNPTGAVLAHMDDQHDYRGWDLWIENGKPAAHLVHKWPDNALKVVARESLKNNEWHHLTVTYDGSSKAAGLSIFVDGKKQETTVAADSLKDSIATEAPLTLAQRQHGSRIDNLQLQDVRIYDRQLGSDEPRLVAEGTRAQYLASRPADKLTAQEREELTAWWLANLDRPYQELAQRQHASDRETDEIKARGTIAHVMQEKPDMPSAYILFRGDYDKRRDPVKAKTPAFLHSMPADLPRSRLGLSQWLMRPENPLTARVTVNRFWQEVFGTGIVRTTGDFGVSGELPSNPELLDWMALEFRDNGWDIKRFFKLLVTSATYRQSAVSTPEKLQKDAANRLLSRGPRFRMDAEMVRDYALCASGLLAEKLGGPSVRPYQPEGVWEAVAMIGSNTRDYRADKGNSLYRRSLYTFWKRAAPPASMDIFNAPSRETCTVRRERTNTPLQALVTLNDPQFVEAARVLAQQALRLPGKQPDDRLDYLAGHILARSFRPSEKAILRTSLQSLLEYYKNHAGDASKLIGVGEAPLDATLPAADLAAWTMLVNEVMNLDEVLNK